LKDFSYRFEKNKKYAIIGHSGSGKSTIINALMRYVELNKGNIYIDDEKLEDLDTSYIIHNVNQQEHIFASGYKNNVTIFNSFPFNKVSFLENVLDKNMLNSIGREHFIFEDTAGNNKGNIISTFIKEFYGGTAFIPKNILVPDIEEGELLEQWPRFKWRRKTGFSYL